jgi:hypothetical protein
MDTFEGYTCGGVEGDQKNVCVWNMTCPCHVQFILPPLRAIPQKADWKIYLPHGLMHAGKGKEPDPAFT